MSRSQQAGPAAEFLPESQRHGILQVGASNLDDVREFLCLGGDRVVHGLDGGDERVLHPLRGGDVHRRGESVIGRLRHVDVVIGMNRLLRSQFAARHFNGAVGDDLVHVHVGLGAAAGLPDAQGELVVELAGDDFVGRLHDELGFVGGKLAQVLVHQRAGLLEDAERADQLRRHGVAADIEMQERALRLRTPVDVGRDFDLSHAVGFGARLRFRGRCHVVSPMGVWRSKQPGIIARTIDLLCGLCVLCG